MNLLLLAKIRELVAQSKLISTIEWLPYSSPQRQSITDLNTALYAAPSEEMRWELFTNLLSLWGDERNTKAAREIFGEETPWNYQKPLVLAPISLEPGRSKHNLSLHCGQAVVCQIVGAQELLKHYQQKLTQGGYAITIEELRNRQSCHPGRKL